MIPTFIFILSIGIQLTAAVFALLLIKTTGRKLAWILIAIAIVLMASRRIVTFIPLVSAGKEITFTIPEFIALAISCLMLIGVLRIGEYFRSIYSTEEALQRTSQTLQSVIQASPLAIIAIDPEGKVILWNKSAERIFGWSEKEALGHFNPIIPEEKQDEFRAIRERILRGESFTGLELCRQKKTGRL